MGAAAHPGHFRWIDVILFRVFQGQGVGLGRRVHWKWNFFQSLYRGRSRFPFGIRGSPCPAFE